MTTIGNDGSKYNLEGIKNLAAGIIERAFYDLVDAYVKMLYIRYPDHGKNTREKYRLLEKKIKNEFEKIKKNPCSKNTDFEEFKSYRVHDEFVHAVWAKNEVIRFFNSEYFKLLAQNSDGSAFIKQARLHAVKWFRDNELFFYAEETKKDYAKKKEKKDAALRKKYMKKHKRKTLKGH